MSYQIKGNLIIMGAKIYPDQMVRFFGLIVVLYELIAIKLLNKFWKCLF